MIQHIALNGVTHHPDNSISPDGDLALCLNLVNNDGTLSLLEAPELLAKLPNNTIALYIHETANYRNIICSCDESLISFAFNYENTDFDLGEAVTILPNITSTPTISHIGNTLVILFADAPMQYAIYKNGEYTPLGSVPPFVQMKVGLHSAVNYESPIQFPSGSESFFPKSIVSDLEGYTIEFMDNMADKLSAPIMSVVNEHIAKYTKNGKFIFPFILRYALRLYDGSLVQHSFPVLLIPNSYLLVSFSGDPVETRINPTIFRYTNISDCKFTPFLADLVTHIIDVPTELADWKDLVQSLDVFISAPIYTYNQNGKVEKITYNRDSGENSTFGVYEDVANERTVTYDNVFHLPRKDDEELQSAVESCSLFYKIHSIPFQSIVKHGDWKKVEIDGNKLVALTSQEVMTDEFNSHQKTIAQTAFVYNNRINIANISQEITGDTIGSTQISGTSAANKMFNLYTTLSANSKSYTIQHPKEYVGGIYETEGNPYSAFPRYIFFPNTGASNTIFHSLIDNIMYDMPMKEHPGLNGSVYFRGFKNAMPAVRPNTIGLPTISAKVDVSFPNKVYTSAVENPFTFAPSNINTISTGTIYALASATQAISQGQFGAYPLYAFTSEGIWALQVSETGGWSSIQPVSRDVITPGTAPLSIDNAVVFFSAQGLMMIQGGEVVCLSKNLSTSTPLAVPSNLFSGIDEDALAEALVFPRVATLAYDYAHRRIYVLGKHIAWIYSLSRATWSHAYSNDAYALNEYPDTILVDKSNNILRLSPQCGKYSFCEFLTRPIKFNSESLRTIRGIITRGNVDNAEDMWSVLYASMHGVKFSAIAGSETKAICRISGTAYKSHCFHFYARLIDTNEDGTNDSFAITGLDCDVESKHTSKLR